MLKSQVDPSFSIDKKQLKQRELSHETEVEAGQEFSSKRNYDF